MILLKMKLKNETIAHILGINSKTIPRIARTILIRGGFCGDLR